MSNWWDADSIAPPPSQAGNSWWHADKVVGAGPAFGSDEYVSALARKHGADPEFVRGLVGSQVHTEGAKGVPILGGLVDKAGAAVSAAARPLTGAGTAGATFGERMGKNLALEQEIAGDFEREHPNVATAANLVGGGVSTAGFGATALGARLLGLTARTLPGQMAIGALSQGTIGGIDAAARGSDPVTGAGIGTILGGGLPGAARIAGAIASPVISNIAARVNPQGYAQRQVARALIESGQTPAQIDAALNAARAEGQGMFTAADAMGNAGQRMLSTVARAPGPGRTEAVNFLEGRQAGQGRRISNQLSEGFEAPETAAQTEARLTQARDVRGDVDYGAARQNAGPVDLTGAISAIDQTLQPGLMQIARPQSGLANDSIEAALQSLRGRLTDGRSMLTDFTAVQRVRGDLADQVNAAVRAGNGNRARLLGGVLRQVDAAMEQASPGFLAANRAFAQGSRDIEAVAQGRTAAMRGRTEDTIPQFQGLSPQGQEAFRSGYADPLIANTQGAAFGANKARPLLNDAFRDEAGVIAPHSERMLRQIEREQTMFDTRAHALGGSRTADNLADQAAMGIDPTIIGHVLTGNHAAALRGMMGAASNALTGNTAAVREQVGRILLARGGLPGQVMQRMLDNTMQRIQNMQRIVAAGTRGAAVIGSEQFNQRNRPN